MSGLTPEARRLLDAARAHDRLPEGDRRRLHAAIAAHAAVGLGAAGASAAPPSLAATTTKLSALAGVKGVVLAASVAALSAAGVHAVRTPPAHRPAPPPRAAQPLPARPPPAARAPAPLPVAATTPARSARTPVAVAAVPPQRAPAVALPRDPPTAPTIARRPIAPVPPRPQAAPPVATSHAARPSASLAPTAPTVASTTDAWVCTREVDRALQRGEVASALAWFERCESVAAGANGPLFQLRGVAALCLAGRDAEARALARRALLRGGDAVARRLVRTCARDLVEAAP